MLFCWGFSQIYNCCTEYHFAECRYAGCHYAEGRYAEWHYAECQSNILILVVRWIENPSIDLWRHNIQPNVIQYNDNLHNNLKPYTQQTSQQNNTQSLVLFAESSLCWVSFWFCCSAKCHYADFRGTFFALREERPNSSV